MSELKVYLFEILLAKPNAEPKLLRLFEYTGRNQDEGLLQAKIFAITGLLNLRMVKRNELDYLTFKLRSISDYTN